jgi:hypothetical protein
VSPGGAVWLALGTVLVLWSVYSGVRSDLPGPTALVRWFAQSWLGRILGLCAWGAAGWHLFCQRP